MNSKLKLILLVLSQFFMTAYICFQSTGLAIVETLNNLYYLSAIILTTIIIVDFSYKSFSRFTISLVFVLLCVFMTNLFVMGSYSDTSLLNISLLAIAFRDTDEKKFIYYDFILRALLFIVAGIMYLSGLIGDIHEERFLGHLLLWYAHHNILGIQVCIMGMELLYLAKGKGKIFAYLGNIIITYFLYTIPVSKTSAMCLALTLVLMFLYDLFPILFSNKVSKFIIRNAFLILTITFAFFTYLYIKNPTLGSIGDKLNNLFTIRLYLTGMNVKQYGYQLFGNSIVTDGYYYYIIDSGYARFLLQFGILATALVAYLYNRAFAYLEKHNKYPLIICVLGMLAHGLMEAFYFTYDTSSFLFVLSYGLFYFESKDKKKVNKPLLAFTCVLLIMLCNSRHIFESVYVSEGYKALLAFYERFKSGNIFSLYDSSLGLGSNILNAYHSNFFSIFNLLALPFKKEQLNHVFVVISCLRYALFACFTCMWLNKLLKDKNLSVLLSVALSLSGLLLTSYNTQFIDAIVFMPLVLYFIEKDNLIGLGITAIITFIFAYNYITPIGVLFVVYVVLKNVINKNTKKLIFESLIVLLSFSFVFFSLLPYKEYLLTDYYGSSNITIIKYISSVLCQFISLSTNNERIYLAISLFACIPLIFFIKDNKKKIILSIISLITLILCFILSNIYDYKVFILFIFVLFYLLTQIFNDLDINKDNLVIRISLGVFLIISVIFYFTLSKANLTNNIYLIMIVTSFTLAILFIKKYGIKAICTVAILELAIASVSFSDNTYKTSGSLTYVDGYTENKTLEAIKENDDGYYRTLNINYDTSLEKKEDDYYIYNRPDNNFMDQVAGFSTNTNKYNTNTSEYLDIINNDDESIYLGTAKNFTSAYNIAGLKYIYIDSKYDDYENISPEDLDADGPVYLNRNVLKEGIYTIKVDDNLVLDYEDDKLVARPNDNSNSQKWFIKRCEDNISFLIINLENDKYITYSGKLDNVIMELSLDGADYGGFTNQKFYGAYKNGKLQILSVQNINMCLDLTSDSVVLSFNSDSESKLLTLVPTSENDNLNIPSYFKKVDNEEYYENKYYIELGYVNNKTINSVYLSALDNYTKEKILREYVALDSSDNKTYNLIDYEVNELCSYPESFDQWFNDGISDIDLFAYVDEAQDIRLELYYDNVLLKSQYCTETNYCKLNVNENETADRIVVRLFDGSGNPVTAKLYSLKRNEKIEEELYNQRIDNSFTNVIYKNDYISGTINISEDNSLVYTYIPYDENWNVYVDNQKVETLNANYGFVAFRTNSGNHNVEFRYKVDRNALCVVISIASLIGLIAIEIIINVKKINSEREVVRNKSN